MASIPDLIEPGYYESYYDQIDYTYSQIPLPTPWTIDIVGYTSGTQSIILMERGKQLLTLNLQEDLCEGDMLVYYGVLAHPVYNRKRAFKIELRHGMVRHVVKSVIGRKRVIKGNFKFETESFEKQTFCIYFERLEERLFSPVSRNEDPSG